MHVGGVAGHDRGERHVGEGLDEPHRRDRADDPAVGGGGEDDVESLGGRLAGVHGGHRVTDGGGLGERHEVGGRESPGRRRVVAQEGAYLAALRLGQEVEDGEPALLVHLRYEVGRIVGRHRGQQASRVGVAAIAHELDLVLRIELLEDVRLELAVLSDGFDDLFALLVRGGLDEVGDLRRVQTGELAVGDAQPRRGDVGHERLDAAPVDDGPRPPRPPQPAREEPPEDPASRWVDAHDLPPAVDLGQLDLVGPDEPSAAEVDEVAGHEVPGEQQLPGTALEAAEVDAVALELDTARLHPRDLPDRDEQVAAPDGYNQADDGRVRLSPDADDHVLDPAEPLSGAIDQGPLGDAR